MILVIFGAGASYDSVALRPPYDLLMDTDWQPPLTDQLFAPRKNFGQLLNAYKDLRGLVVRLRSALVSGVAPLEVLLAQLEQRSKDGDTRAATQMMSMRFYLATLTNTCSAEWLNQSYGATNYHALVDRLNQWARAEDDSVAYVTFNYDTLIEAALRDEMNISFDFPDQYIADDRARLFKLHGSCSWSHPVAYTVTQPPSWYIENASALKISPEIVIPGGVQGSFIPALAVPIQNKPDFECPPGHLDLLRQLLPEVNRILVVGWRGMEGHFMGELRAHRPTRVEEVLIANGGQTTQAAQETWDRMCAGAGGVPMDDRLAVMSPNGFSELVESQELETFLS